MKTKQERQTTEIRFSDTLSEIFRAGNTISERKALFEKVRNLFIENQSSTPASTIDSTYATGDISGKTAIFGISETIKVNYDLSPYHLDHQPDYASFVKISLPDRGINLMVATLFRDNHYYLLTDIAPYPNATNIYNKLENALDASFTILHIEGINL